MKGHVCVMRLNDSGPLINPYKELCIVPTAIYQGCACNKIPCHMYSKCYCNRFNATKYHYKIQDNLVKKDYPF